MTLLQRLFELVSPVVAQLCFDVPLVGIDPPYTVISIVHSVPYTTQEGTVTELTPITVQFASFGESDADRDARSLAIIATLLPVRDDGIRSVIQCNRHSHLDTHYKLPVDIVEFDIQETF